MLPGTGGIFVVFLQLCKPGFFSQDIQNDRVAAAVSLAYTHMHSSSSFSLKGGDEQNNPQKFGYIEYKQQETKIIKAWHNPIFMSTIDMTVGKFSSIFRKIPIRFSATRFTFISINMYDRRTSFS